MKKFYFLCIGIFIISSFNPLLAHQQRDSEINVGKSMKEILNSVNEIITYGLQTVEKELKKFQKTLKEKGAAVHEKAEKSLVEELQKILLELKKLEKVLKENLAEGEDPSKEKHEQYRKNRQSLEEKVAELRKRIKEFAEEIEKEYRLFKEPISKRIQELLEEMKKAINRMQERLKRKRADDKVITI